MSITSMEEVAEIKAKWDDGGEKLCEDAVDVVRGIAGDLPRLLAMLHGTAIELHRVQVVNSALLDAITAAIDLLDPEMSRNDIRGLRDSLIVLRSDARKMEATP